ncbi:MAG: tetratricopeptide repeat protein [Ardenticatenaceae bacterium]|nr:tetratricopeptide repeat protein [Ardenticatenaceae bacterium]
MSAFGVLLRRHRLQCRDLHTGRPLTQERLAELLSLQAGIEGYSGSTVSNWERGLNQIRRDDRAVLVALVAVLHQRGGLQTQEEANQFLLAGNYRPLDKEELVQVDAHWHFPHPARLGEMPSPLEQEAALPSTFNSLLFGVDRLIEDVISQLKLRQPSVVILMGIGGSGKTAVAQAVARQAIRQYLFAQVIWLSLADVMDGEGGILWLMIVDELCQRLLSEDNQNVSPNQKLMRLRFKLSQAPYLMVIDDLPLGDNGVDIFTQLQRILGSGKCLITARHQPPLELEAVTFPMPELSPQDALALLRYQAELLGIHSTGQVSEQDWIDLYGVVGGHPLALRMIPRLARLMPLSEIIAGWQQVSPGYIATVYKAVYDEVWASLSAAEKEMMAVMPLLAATGGTLAYVQTLCGLPQGGVWPVLTRLIECCLVEAVGEWYDIRYRIHRLTAQYVSHRWRTESSEWPETKMILQALMFWQQFFEQLAEAEWHLVDKEQPNLMKALQLSLTLPPEAITPAFQEVWQRLFVFIFRYVERRGHTAVWLPVLEAICDKFTDWPDVHVALLNRVGELHRMQHDLPLAVEMHQQALELAQQYEEAAVIAQAHLNLGNDYLLAKQYDLAVEHGRLALYEFEQLGLSGRERAAVLNLLGTAARRQGDLDQARILLQEAASIWSRLKHQPELVRTLHNLALAFQSQQDWESAQKYIAEAKVVLSTTASELDRTLIYLAEGAVYFEQSQYQQAAIAFNRINLAYLRQANHIVYQAYTLNNLGNVAYALKRYSEAEKLFLESIQLWQYLTEPLEMANSLGVLGDVFLAQGKQEDAKLVFAQAVHLLEQYDHDNLMVNLKRAIEEILLQLQDTEKGD